MINDNLPNIFIYLLSIASQPLEITAIRKISSISRIRKKD